MIYFVISIPAAVVLLYFLAIMPRMWRRPDYTPLLGTYYAHRGLHDNGAQVPENSLAAFRKAVESGFGIELDIQLTRDEQVVVFHDEELQRACGRPGRVRDYTLEELKQFPLFESEERIPALREMLSLIGGRVPLIVEIKMYTASTKICELADKLLSGYQGRYCVESFHPLAILWYRQNRPGIIRGQLSSNFRKEMEREILPHFIVHHLLTNCIGKPDFIAYCHRYEKELSRVLCRRCYRSLSVAWTIRSQEELDQVKNAFDLFIFEGFLPRESAAE